MPSTALSTPRPLNDKDRAFVDAYISNGFIASDAAVAAGHKGTKATARNVGWELLQKPSIRAELAARMTANSTQADKDCSDVLQRLKDQALGHMGDLATWDQSGLKIKPSSELSAAQMSLIKEIKCTEGEFGATIEIKLRDNAKPLDTLAKIYKLIGPDIVQQTVNNITTFLSVQHGFNPKDEQRLGQIIDVADDNTLQQLPAKSKFIMDGQ